MMSRRGLFLTGSAAAALAMVGNVPLLNVIAEEERYALVVGQANELVTSANEFRCAPGFDNLDAYSRWLAQSDEMIGNLLRLFPEEVDPDTVQAMFDNQLLPPAFSETEMREIVPGLVPIAIVWQMLRTYRVPFHMLRQQNLIKFAEKYRNHVTA